MSTEQLEAMLADAGVDERTRSLIDAATLGREVLDRVIVGGAVLACETVSWRLTGANQ